MQSLQELDAQLHSGALRGAQRIQLRAHLRSFPEQLYQLADTLEVLDLSGNPLSELPDDLTRSMLAALGKHADLREDIEGDVAL